MAIYPKEYLSSQRTPATASSCFLLMPFSRQFDAVHSAIIAACESPSLLLAHSRADDFYGAGHIMEDVLEGIVRSEYVVADLTSKNPNVFYELGIAHSCKEASKVIMITQSIDDVPFDLRHLRCIIYRADDAGLRKLSHDLERAFSSDAEGVFRFAIPDNGNHEFNERLSGRDGCFYTFVIPEIWLGTEDAKYTIQVCQHSLSTGSERFGPASDYICVGERKEIYPTDWSLRLDRVQNRSATFSVVRGFKSAS